MIKYAFSKGRMQTLVYREFVSCEKLVILLKTAMLRENFS